jgi:hypothetical protein
MNLILIGVPTNLDTSALQELLREKVEEAQQKMVVRNPSKYGPL